MVHGLETMKRLNDKAVSEANKPEPKFALVSTVDSFVGNETFTDHFVMLFETADQAVSEAVHILLCAGMIDQCENTCQFLFADEWYDTEDQVLEEFQNSLGATEFFHIKPIATRVTTSKPHKSILKGST